MRPSCYGKARKLGRWLAAILLVAGAFPGRALEPSTPLANLMRQSWAMENGLPQNTVQALAQTRDGFVWLATEVGLVRFDGNGFATFDTTSTLALPGSDVRCLLASGDGALWIGTSAGLARWKDGAITTFTAANGLRGNDIKALEEASDGTLWVWTDQGLLRFEEGRFVESSAATRLPFNAIANVTSDGQGTMWVGTQDRVSLYSDGRWEIPEPQAGMLPWIPRGSIRFLQSFRGRVASADNSTVAILDGDRKRGGNALDRFSVGKELPGSRIQALLFDREGTLWIGTNGGLARFAGNKLETLPVTDPLSRSSVLSLMEDREGDLWVGTESDGLHILRDQRFRTFGMRDGLSSENVSAVVEDKAETLWVGTSGGGLNELERTPDGAKVVRTFTVRDGLASDVILSLAAAPDGDLWVGTPDGLSRIRSGSLATFTSADGLPDDFIRSLLVDADGSLWIGTRRGLTHWAGGTAQPRMEVYSQSSGLGNDLVGAMARDTSGDLWVATLAGLSRIKDGKIANYTTADGLSSNVITALLPRAMGTLLIGTQDHGWNLWDGRRFSKVTGNGLDRATIHAILDDGAGHLWFATGNGIARCDCNEGTAGMTEANCSHWMEFGSADGLRSRETATNSHPSAWRSRLGSLWFATPKGLVEVDPAHFPVNTVPPPVAIERFAVDDVDQALHAAGSWLRVPAGHVHFQFDYAGLSFVAPQKVRYRYKLDGFDRDWTDAGARRSAYYTNIPPARYTFRVQAANNDGVWNTAGAAIEFDLRPHFYQTIWFYVLAIVAMAGAIFLLLRRRLRLAESEFRAVLGERNRIAREIHDTLAQGYVGISVQLELLAELLRLKKLDAAEKHLDATRGYVREGLDEARQSIWALRSQDTGEQTLPVRLRRMVESSGGNGFEAKFSIFGAYRPLPLGTEREFLRVAQEAIHNVSKHAGAKNVTVRLEYGPGEIALEVRDDGRGFTAGEEHEPPPGHYGLTGMRERAKAVGGTLEVKSEPGAGTTVRLEAPARRSQRKESN
ncbi:MAG: two-component regulator propeller domain-containing protein [Terracidiphilus sp.]